MNRIVLKSTLAGLLGIILLFSLYFIILSWVSRDFRHPFEQFLAIKYWMGALFFGFGLEVGLFWFVRLLIKKSQAQRVAVASGGVSGATMIACCVHHLTDFAPILGLSALSIFLAKYQLYLLSLAILFNVFGILYMLRIIKKHKLYPVRSFKEI